MKPRLYSLRTYSVVLTLFAPRLLLRMGYLRDYSVHVDCNAEPLNSDQTEVMTREEPILILGSAMTKREPSRRGARAVDTFMRSKLVQGPDKRFYVVIGCAAIDVVEGTAWETRLPEELCKLAKMSAPLVALWRPSLFEATQREEVLYWEQPEHLVDPARIPSIEKDALLQAYNKKSNELIKLFLRPLHVEAEGGTTRKDDRPFSLIFVDTKTTRLPQIPRAPVVVSPRSENIRTLPSENRGVDVSMLQPSPCFTVESSTRSAAPADGAPNLPGTENQGDAGLDEADVVSLHSALTNLEVQQYTKHCTKCNKLADALIAKMGPMIDKFDNFPSDCSSALFKREVKEVLARCEKAFKEFGTWGSGTKDDGNGGVVTSKAGEKKLPALIDMRDSLKQKQKEFQQATRLPVIMPSASSTSAAAAPLQLAAGGPTPPAVDSEALAAAVTQQLLGRLLPPPAATFGTFGTPEQPAVVGRNTTLEGSVEMEVARVPCMPCHKQSHKVYVWQM